MPLPIVASSIGGDNAVPRAHPIGDADAGRSYTPGEHPAFAEVMDRVSAAFALVSGAEQTIVYANQAFRRLLGLGTPTAVGPTIAQAFAPRDVSQLSALLDQAHRTGIPVRSRRIERLDAASIPLCCSAWPDLGPDGDTRQMLVELRPSTDAELSLALQREVAERLLLSALREQQSAELAEHSRRSAEFLAAEGRRIGESLDEGATMGAINRTRLPLRGAWCIVDSLADDRSMHRLAIVHPDATKQALLATIEGHWIPDSSDRFGLPAAVRDVDATALPGRLETFTNASQQPDVAAALDELGAGELLTVPLLIRDQLIGALTFVAAELGRFSADDVQLAIELGARSAKALERARLYGESIALRLRAESASQAKSTFLGMMSHELRTPLNAIGGYVDLIDMELRGPVTEAQHTDLARIRTNQKYLTSLITDLLNLTKVGGGNLVYNTTNIAARETVLAGISIVEPLIAQRNLSLETVLCDADVVASGDGDKVTQILVNLLSNAIKFTPPGGRLMVDCADDETTVRIRVGDTGIGIPADKLDVIFDPFMQVDASTLGTETGVGLGLAISRGLARAMRGDITVESTLGEGAQFTLTLPRGREDVNGADQAR
ncbi:ATP-binding protein [soil metagenome]